MFSSQADRRVAADVGGFLIGEPPPHPFATSAQCQRWMERGGVGGEIGRRFPMHLTKGFLDVPDSRIKTSARGEQETMGGCDRSIPQIEREIPRTADHPELPGAIGP